jgi:hypothetical protein
MSSDNIKEYILKKISECEDSDGRIALLFKMCVKKTNELEILREEKSDGISANKNKEKGWKQMLRKLVDKNKNKDEIITELKNDLSSSKEVCDDYRHKHKMLSRELETYKQKYEECIDSTSYVIENSKKEIDHITTDYENHHQDCVSKKEFENILQKYQKEHKKKKELKKKIKKRNEEIKQREEEKSDEEEEKSDEEKSDEEKSDEDEEKSDEDEEKSDEDEEKSDEE